MRSSPILRAVTILGLGAAGLIGGHALGYAVSVPDTHHRGALLEATGHGYLPSASRLALMLGIAAVVAGIASGYLHRPRTAQPGFARAALWLVALQCGAFVALEIAERALVSAPLESLSLPILVIGLLTQAVVALALALLVVGLRRLGRTLATAIALAAAVANGAPLVVRVRVPSSRARSVDRARGPPVLRMG